MLVVEEVVVKEADPEKALEGKAKEKMKMKKQRRHVDDVRVSSLLQLHHSSRLCTFQQLRLADAGHIP